MITITGVAFIGFGAQLFLVGRCILDTEAGQQMFINGLQLILFGMVVMA